MRRPAAARPTALPAIFFQFYGYGIGFAGVHITYIYAFIPGMVAGYRIPELWNTGHYIAICHHRNKITFADTGLSISATFVSTPLLHMDAGRISFEIADADAPTCSAILGSILLRSCNLQPEVTPAYGSEFTDNIAGYFLRQAWTV